MIELTEAQSTQLYDLFGWMITEIREQDQGSCNLHEKYFEAINQICPSIKSVSANYYDCDGERGFALRLTDQSNSLIHYNDDVNNGNYKGFAIAPNGHLEKYLKYRAKI